jgi:hypothetical protein
MWLPQCCPSRSSRTLQPQAIVIFHNDLRPKTCSDSDREYIYITLLQPPFTSLSPVQYSSNSPWVACTAKERVSPVGPSHTSAPRRLGSSSPLRTPSRRSATWPRRVTLLPRSELSSGERGAEREPASLRPTAQCARVETRRAERRLLCRDSHGIPQVKMIAGNKIVRILRAWGKRHNNQLARAIPVHTLETAGTLDCSWVPPSPQKGRKIHTVLGTN